MTVRVGMRELVVTGGESAANETVAKTLDEESGVDVRAVPDDDLSSSLSSTAPAALVVVDDPPASDGVATFERVRADGFTLPVFLVADDADPDRVEAALSAGVTEYVSAWDDDRAADLLARIRAHVRTPTLDGAVQARRWESVVGSLAHDMKNPLNVVSGRLELLDLDETHGGAIERSLGRVESLIDEVSLFASAVGSRGDSDEVALAETARQVWAELDTKSATLSVETDRTVLADRDALENLLSRLFENAIHHGGDDVAVTVGDTPSGFYVADDGPGIGADDPSKVFEQGYGTARHGEGYGLFVASRLAAVNDWTLTVDESESGGARFEVLDR